MKRRKTRLFPATFSHAGASSYRTAISSCFSFFASLGHSAGQIVSHCVVFELWWVDRSPTCIHLEAEPLRFGNELVQSIPLRARFFSLVTPFQ